MSKRIGSDKFVCDICQEEVYQLVDYSGTLMCMECRDDVQQAEAEEQDNLRKYQKESVIDNSEVTDGEAEDEEEA